ncbi:MAG: phenylalanine--tRNA ligase subunit alpha [Candidatus Micrarchaeota archaeon]|nr:phenylalanine--tRNA ligase subunit alpha [Candidatus Micrarchaeota archaeon]
MHEDEKAVLNLIKRENTGDPDYIRDKLGMDRDSLLRAIEGLIKANMIKVDRDTGRTARLTSEGKRYVKKFPEEALAELLRKKGGRESLASINNRIGIIWAKKNAWIEIEKGTVILTEKGRSASQEGSDYKYRALLKELNTSKSEENTEVILKRDADLANDLKNRNLIEITDKGRIKEIHVIEGADASGFPEDEGIGTLTREMIVSGKWKKEKLRKYDINSNAEALNPARPHPMHELLDVIRSAYFNLGFTEVSGPIIESAFWNFDALFVPQDHPAREMQDTFFLSNPKKITIEDVELMHKLKRAHRKNWKDLWKESVAQQALLRTHATTVSAHYIRKFASSMESSYPIKLFSVGRVFRNESIDYKHLAEFYQMDGIIIGDNLTFSNLIDTLSRLYSQLGLEVKFKPAYFPFVEPGLEIYYYDEKKKDTIELGGAGIIRKEITRAMGTNKTVLAWGPGVDRLIFNFMDIDSLLHLYKNNVGWLRSRPELKL